MSIRSFRRLVVAAWLGIAPASVAQSGRNLVRQGFEDSYITILGGYRTPEPLWFEASYAPHFFLYFRQSAWGAVFTPKIVLRMYREDSAPVSTPSYMPGLTFFWWPTAAKDSTTGRARFYSFLIRHFSNGQRGEYVLDDTVNHTTGSFSTNFVEAAVNLTSSEKSWFTGYRLGVEWHPPFLFQDGATYAHYPSLLVRSEIQGLLPVSQSARGIAGNEVRFTVDAIGPTYCPKLCPADLDDIKKDLGMGPFLTALSPSVTVSFRPAWLDDFGFFVNFFSGWDYYNIWADRRMTVLRAGLLTKGSNFGR